MEQKPNSIPSASTNDEQSTTLETQDSSDNIATNAMLADVLTQIVRQRLDELTIEKWWDFGDFEEIRDKDFVASQIVDDLIKHFS